ncbi:MAG TPA: hypothetical protein VLH77_00480, partial [Gammaproteobacteria bacterium]|nr:hypothetical protein [Gammaproteobacteria bacterium]
MQNRKKREGKVEKEMLKIIVIVNILHSKEFHNKALEKDLAKLNAKKKGVSYVLVTADFDTKGVTDNLELRQAILKQVADLIGQAVSEHNPSEMYLCLDYNEGNSGSPLSSIPYLTEELNQRNIQVPYTYILDGSNKEALNLVIDGLQESNNKTTNIMEFRKLVNQGFKIKKAKSAPPVLDSEPPHASSELAFARIPEGNQASLEEKDNLLHDQEETQEEDRLELMMSAASVLPIQSPTIHSLPELDLSSASPESAVTTPEMTILDAFLALRFTNKLEAVVQEQNQQPELSEEE